MTLREMQSIDNRIERIRFRSKPVVLVSLEDWNKIEELVEESEMLKSKKLPLEIARARKEKKIYSAAEAKRILGL